MTKSKINIYNKINSISKNGRSGIFSYYVYVDQLVNNSQYSLLEDVLINYYNIDARRYKTIDDLKRQTYPKILELSDNKFHDRFKKLLTVSNVYQIGFHFFDSNTNKYLGDIKEFDMKVSWEYYDNDDLRQKLDDKLSYIGLEVLIGLRESLIECLPEFISDDSITISYNVGDQVKWNGGIYECILAYTWHKNNRIYPSNQVKWKIIDINYSKIEIVGVDSILNKYKAAIIELKKSNNIAIDRLLMEFSGS